MQKKQELLASSFDKLRMRARAFNGLNLMSSSFDKLRMRACAFNGLNLMVSLSNHGERHPVARC